MSSTVDTEGAATGSSRQSWWKSHSELGLCILLLAVGVLVLVDAITIPTDFAQRGPVGPKAVPVVVGTLLLLVAVLLARDVLRGGRGEAEGGEDVDLDAPTDWRTLLLLSGFFLLNAALVNVIGFPASSAILFWGAAYSLGSRNVVRDPLIAAGIAVITWFAFNNLLGVPLPGGPLMGVL